MKVILAETAGFCYGVERAVNLARETAKARGGAMLGSIVHNAGVVREIEDLGMRLITSPDQAKAGETVLIRAHGESRATLDALRERGAEVMSAVCPHDGGGAVAGGQCPPPLQRDVGDAVPYEMTREGGMLSAHITRQAAVSAGHGRHPLSG